MTMPEATSNSVTLLVGPGQLPISSRVWGTGGWLFPEEREALDWLTLCRLLGWEVRIQRADEPTPPRESAASSCIVVACDPDALSDDYLAWLEAQLAKSPVLVIMRAATSQKTLSDLCTEAQAAPVTGRALLWRGPGAEQKWHCRKPLAARPLRLTDDHHIWATLDGAPISVARRFRCGVIVALGFHPSEARDSDGAASALLQQLLISGSHVPAAWFDWRNTMVLRMDDPGGAQNVHSQSWSHRKLSEADWQAIGIELSRRNAKLSLAYIAGWVDDGDTARGKLLLNGSDVGERVAGAIYDSPLVVYDDLRGHAPGTRHDYTAEYRGIQKLSRAGLSEVELHGYTHMHPDTKQWADSGDRYQSVNWFRELGRDAARYLDSRDPGSHPLAQALARFKKYFAVKPTTLVAPGEAFDEAAQIKALDLGVELFGSYYLGIRYDNRFCWTQHVCSPYLNEPDGAWLDSGLPIVGYFHDRDLALNGIEWLSSALDRWQELGVERLIDYRELAASATRTLQVQERDGSLRIVVRSVGRRDLPRPKNILLSGPKYSCATVVIDGIEVAATIEWDDNDIGHLRWSDRELPDK